MKNLWILSLLLLVGCSDPVEYSYKTDIVSVYYHEHGRYSVGIENAGILKIKRLPQYIPVNIYTDAPKGGMWYECDYTYDRFDHDTTGSCDIHIHDVNDLGTAGWNRGKFGSGTTHRIDGK